MTTSLSGDPYDEHIPIFSSDHFKFPINANNGSESNRVIKLLRTSDAYISKSKDDLLHRYTLLSYALKCLEFILHHYSEYLTPQLELLTYLKIAIALVESEVPEKAEAYLLRLLKLSKRNNLVSISFVSEFIGGQILAKNNPKLSISYVEEKITRYDELGLHQLSDLFRVLKVTSYMHFNPIGATNALLTLSERHSVDPFLRGISLLYLCNVLSYTDPAYDCKEKLDKAQELLFKNKRSPIQLRAMLLLLKFSILVKSGSHEESEIVMNELNVLVSAQHSEKWVEWKETGTFQIELPLPISDGEITTIFCEASWLTSNEFVIIYYALTALKMLVHNPKGNASSRALQYCRDLIDNEIQQSSSNGVLSSRIAHLRDTIIVYQAWSSFLKEKPNFNSEIEEIVRVHNRNELKDIKLLVTDDTISNILYLFGISSLADKHRETAEYYFLLLKNRKSVDANVGNECMRAYSVLAPPHLSGISKTDELKVFSTIHLLLLSEYHATKPGINDAPAAENLALMYMDLDCYARNFKPQAFSHNELSRCMPLITYWALKELFSTNSSDLVLNLETKNLEEISNSESGLAFTSILNFLLFRRFHGDTEVSKRYLERTLNSVKGSLMLRIQRSLNRFLLTSLIEELNSHADQELYEEIKVRLDFVSNNQ